MKEIICAIILLYYFTDISKFVNINSNTGYCDCDTNQVKQLINSNKINEISQYDTSIFKKYDFYTLDSSINKMLWYRDIENPDTTKFTNLWNDYKRENYHANHLDFVANYSTKPNIELAFQLGPNDDLWAYHTYVIKKINCCYLATHSYFRHARFTYKSYSILDEIKVDSLFKILNQLNTSSIVAKPEYSYSAYFADNRSHKNYYIDLEKESKSDSSESTKNIKMFYDFISKHIKWTKTYSL